MKMGGDYQALDRIDISEVKQMRSPLNSRSSVVVITTPKASSPGCNENLEVIWAGNGPSANPYTLMIASATASPPLRK